jgi:uncharacterized membrane-anchored protein
MSTKQTPERQARPALRWTGILFAFAVNLLLVTLADLLVQRLGLPLEFELVATFVAPLVAGVASGFYVPYRAAVHTFWGAMVSIPVLALFVFGGVWPPAVLAGAFCAMGGALTEIARRRRQPQP